jgi:hypothetical protein
MIGELVAFAGVIGLAIAPRLAFPTLRILVVLYGLGLGPA